MTLGKKIFNRNLDIYHNFKLKIHRNYNQLYKQKKDQINYFARLWSFVSIFPVLYWNSPFFPSIYFKSNFLGFPAKRLKTSSEKESSKLFKSFLGTLSMQSPFNLSSLIVDLSQVFTHLRVGTKRPFNSSSRIRHC